MAHPSWTPRSTLQAVQRERSNSLTPASATRRAHQQERLSIFYREEPRVAATSGQAHLGDLTPRYAPAKKTNELKKTAW